MKVPIALLLASVVFVCQFSFQATADDSNVRLFAAHALALRTAGAAGDGSATDVLVRLPGVGTREAETLTTLWRPFFENAIVKLGRLDTSAPVALYYNPLLDIAVLAIWAKRGNNLFVTTIRALPGERIGAPNADFAEQPAWMLAEDPVDALGQVTSERLDAFRRAHPANASSGARNVVTFAAAAKDMRAVLPRLVWLLATRAQWINNSWLQQTLISIDEALRTRDSTRVMDMAAETDALTVDAIVRLPEGFASRLVLDAVLPLPNEDRLLIASLPDDGDVYVLGTCLQQAENCELRRLMLVSLSAR